MVYPALASPADLAVFLQRDLTEEEATSAEQLLAAASSAVRGRKITGQIISLATTTLTLVVDPDDPWITLPQQPVVSVSSVSLNGSAVTDYTAVNGRLYRHCGWWPSSTANHAPPMVTIVSTHGYDPVPADVVTAVTMWTAVALDGAVPVKSESVGDYSVSYADVAPGSRLGLTLDALRDAYGTPSAGSVGVGNSRR